MCLSRDSGGSRLTFLSFSRMDDYNDPVHLERISTLNFFQVEDLGAILPKGQRSLNYTLEDYRTNEWYYSWLPYTNLQQDKLTTYQASTVPCAIIV